MTMPLSAPPGATPTPRRRLPLLALLAANGVSIIGNFMTLVALPWFVLETTGSVAKTGITAVAVTLPQVLAGFFAGSLVDRLGYRRASVLADLTAGASVALVPLLYHSQRLAFGQLVALVFLGNLLNTPGTTARQSMLPDLITRAAVPVRVAMVMLLAGCARQNNFVIPGRRAARAPGMARVNRSGMRPKPLPGPIADETGDCRE